MKAYVKAKRQLLRNKKVRTAYAELGPEFAFIQCLIEMRMKKKMTQAELARKIGTKQSAVARLESGSYNPSLAFLEKVASALDARLLISIS